jgi:hypothetical protein
MFDRHYHIGRSWPGCGTPMEDECPCPQEPCGLIDEKRVVAGCEQHDTWFCKTMRSGHPADSCPGAKA